MSLDMMMYGIYPISFSLYFLVYALFGRECVSCVSAWELVGSWSKVEGKAK